MGSGQMVGGFDGWQGASPGGGGGGSGVQSVVAGNGITVNAADPQNPIVSLTNFPYTLNSLYTAGLSISDTANTLVGSYHSIFFADDGAEAIDDLAASIPALAELRYARSTLRWSTSPWPTMVDRMTVQVDSGNREGGLFNDYYCKTTGGAERQYSRFRSQVFSNADTGQWLDPQIFFGGLLSTFEFGLAGGDLETFVDNVHVFNSDGNLTSRPLLPAGGPYFLASHVIDGYQFQTPADGTTYGYWIKNLGRNGYTQDAHSGSGGNTLTDSHAFWQLTRIADSGFTAAFSTAMELYPGDLRIVNFHGDELAKLTFQDGENSPVSGANEAAVKYIGTTDRLALSNNTAAYSPIATLADIGPAAGTLVTVDVPSASLDFETATTPVVVPTAAGRRFLPIAAYVEFTSVTALTVGPSIKLGNNVAHDNVAPVLAVANTAVTDTLVPFVMASGPVMIPLTTTGIIAEFTVNATATTALGRVHVIGVYTA